MFFVHGPAGFLSIAPLKRAWKKLPQRERLFLFVLGFIAGVGPDFDLLYYYLFSADAIHRYFFTHAPLPWFALGVLIYLIGKLIKKPIVGWAGIVVVISALSHVFLDALTGRVLLFWPFSHHIFGLSSIPGMPDTFFLNLTLFNYSLEVLIFCAFLYVAGTWLLEKKFHLFLKIIIPVAAVACVSFLVFANAHVIHTLPTTYYNDRDRDGIDNVQDADMDGDGIQNSADRDANGDGRKNRDELTAIGQRARHAWNWPLGNFLYGEVRRFGLVINPSLPLYILDETGILLEPEMEQDYETNPDGYATKPDSPLFSERAENLYAFLNHQGLLLGPKTTPMIGDIVFLKRNDRLFIGLCATEKPAGILYVDSQYPADFYTLESMSVVGEIVAIGHFSDAF